MALRLRIALGAMASWGAIFAVVVLVADPDGAGVSGGSVLGPLMHALSVINALAVLLAFAAIAMRSKTMRAIEAVTWIFAMMFLYPLALPAFWFLHVWRAPRDAGTGGRSSSG